MLKKIPGNTDYLINLNKDIIDGYGELVELVEQKTHVVSLEMFGNKMKVTSSWLSLMAWYEVSCIPNLQEHLKKIKFCQCLDRIMSINCKSLMMFSEPIYYKDGFRIIPNYPRYAINLDRVVIDILTNLVVTKKEYLTGYESLYIYNPDRNGYRYTRVHRLLALAWIPNNDFASRPFVNHLDGNRSNNRLENLEWCSASENCRHALDTGLNPCSIMMKSRDCFTGEVVIYRSASEMSKKLGTTSVCGNAYNAKLPGYRFKGRYEIKLFEDNTPWYFENAELDLDDHGKSIYTITVLNKKTGETEIFSNVKPFYRRFKLWTKSGRLEDGVVAFKNKYPDYDISYKKNSIVAPYQILDVKTGQVVLVNSMLEASKVTGVSRTEIQFDLSRGLKFTYLKKWVISPGPEVNEIKVEEYLEKKQPFSKVVIVNSVDGSEKIASSIKDAWRLTGITTNTIAKFLDTGKLIKGQSFRTLEQ